MKFYFFFSPPQIKKLTPHTFLPTYLCILYKYGFINYLYSNLTLTADKNQQNESQIIVKKFSINI
ncbi:MAG: hypothetical protein CVU13_07685 [Bacteroidetes bacterium HGW-Bacteroidetes-8]|nr:MAG: hypothetical protein CVU13_07685 [Bacteroidetes bacterium HGW-Bacteroidetes-8]